MYDDPFDNDDPYAAPTPWLRRPGVQAAVVAVAVGTVLLATLVSSCGPRRLVRPAPTTTTVPAVEVEIPVPPVPTGPAA